MPQIWKVPARNPQLHRPGAELDKVARGLAAGSRVRCIRCAAWAGSARSQLAIEYAYAHAGDYDVVWWVTAEEPAAIPDQFTALAAQLGLDPAATPTRFRPRSTTAAQRARAGC